VVLPLASDSPGRPGRYETLIGLTPKVRERIVAALERYAETRYGDVAKLAGIDPPEYRLRVGPWRVRFAWDQTAGAVAVLHVFGRGQGYE
jgi:mRNA-degrading endonuclease RelE of RelBE toxin-antitoxin system